MAAGRGMICIKFAAIPFVRIAGNHAVFKFPLQAFALSAAHTTLPPAGGARDAVTSVSLVFLCNCVNALCTGGIALFLPLIREDLHITFTQAGLLSVAATATYALGQIPAGFLTDRFGPKRLFFIGVIG